MVDPKDPHDVPPPPLRGEELALSMVTQLAALNQNFAVRGQLERKQIALLDELNGRLEVLTRACVIAAEMKDQGKKVGIGDFAEAMAQADEEIMGDGEEEGDEEDEEDEEDGEGDIPARR